MINKLSRSRAFGLLGISVGALLFLSYFFTGIMTGRSFFNHGYDWSETILVISDFLYMAGGGFSVGFGIYGILDKEDDKNGKMLDITAMIIGVLLIALVVILMFV